MSDNLWPLVVAAPLAVFMIAHLEGVVGVRSELTYRIDDRRIPPRALQSSAAP